MNIQQLEEMCKKYEQELLEKYFGNLVKEAAIERPETIGDYTKDLPLKIEKEYLQFLKNLWNEICPNKTIPLESILDKRYMSAIMTDDDWEGINLAYEDATRRTLWERITKSNHKDVTYYKGLLEECTRELLLCLRCDFIEDINCMI